MKLLLAGLCATAMFPAIANAVSVSADCSVDHVALAVVSGETITTSSSEWADVPGLVVNVNLKGSPADCIAITFTGSSRTTAGTEVGIRAVIDATKAALPPGIRLANIQHTSFEAGAAVFVLRNLNNGAHQVTIQWRSNAGTPVWLRNRSFEAKYKGQ